MYYRNSIHLHTSTLINITLKSIARPKAVLSCKVLSLGFCLLSEAQFQATPSHRTPTNNAALLYIYYTLHIESNKPTFFFFFLLSGCFFFLVGSTSVVLLDAQEKECSLWSPQLSFFLVLGTQGLLMSHCAVMVQESEQAFWFGYQQLIPQFYCSQEAASDRTSHYRYRSFF